MYPDRIFRSLTNQSLVSEGSDSALPPALLSSDAEKTSRVRLRKRIAAKGLTAANPSLRGKFVVRGAPAPNKAYARFKVGFDMIGSVVLLVALSPLFPVIALVIKCTSPGPVIFKQRRLTQSGREFTLYKFRTMQAGAETGRGAVWAEHRDPRVTKIGSFLRTTRLDELPQLINVLNGEMSLIGPRPERPELAVALENEIPGFHRRLQVKAGLTGLAQIRNGYSSCNVGHRRKLAWDRLYIRKRSVALDIWIALKTVVVVISGRGAR